ncbi:phosphoribosylformylglycinamidine synthase [Clostridium grantii]|uniref:Phosphoribosylformylglycinamidine synthase n=1 Tax=Clostridium grantii DSM 8605 TaxID=1121316 RepID=A0A1M5QEG0_9CLOT|nr:phosphoribosylformylglycinamidine synthase [Clostridium grantii]SHH12246.1 phosphoribosylformylglycinamidine synthase [Clostridium grantii DSM 8605]
MNNNVKRIYVQKKAGFDVEASALYSDLTENLGIEGIEKLRVVNRYDIEGVSKEIYEMARNTIFSEPTVDDVFDEEYLVDSKMRIFGVEYLPGQYDQRADSAAQCIQLISHGDSPKIACAKVVVIEGNISDESFEKIKKYYINNVDSREASLEKPEKLDLEMNSPEDVAILNGLIDMNDEELSDFMDEHGFAMSLEDLKFCQEYFRDEEKRNPTITEIKVIDTYWSDHCRHTTFETKLENIEIEDSKYTAAIKESFDMYKDSREFVYKDRVKEMTLMDIAVMGMKKLRKEGKLDDLEVSEEINACSIEADVEIDKQIEKYLIMFKNETHNHPTEIEPFGGAATCLGGAIRDPLSGRSYVYQAMRITGSGDPTKSMDETLSGKLPQRQITLGASDGYSSYGNQIGLATGLVREIYDEGFVAKRMEIGAVIAAAPKKNVRRETPKKGDIIILVGGRTGRDGCGGATGSSKEHDETSIFNCGAEVQKGNAPTERKLQRLFRNEKVSAMIKKCNDFGAGGVAVAIGELSDGLEINLDAVPKKYDGLDGTELAISESQERIAVVVEKEMVDEFIKYSEEENLEAVVVSEVTDDRRLKMVWRNKTIVSLSRDFLDTNGVRQKVDVKVEKPEDKTYFEEPQVDDIEEMWKNNLKDLNVASQRGLTEKFDSSIGAGTVLMPFGGKYQLTPSEVMCAKIPLIKGETKTGTLMSYGYDSKLAKWSPFHGALYAVVDSVTKIVAAGGDYKNVKLTFQEYFERLGKNPEKWGKPFSALLGAFYAQNKLEIAAIGGKDSMSGTFKDLNVPPTLVSFAVDVVNTDNVISSEFKHKGSKVALIQSPIKEDGIIDFEVLKTNFEKVSQLIKEGKVLSSNAVTYGGIAAAISKMCFGNKIGMNFSNNLKTENLFTQDYGSIILELAESIELKEDLEGIQYKLLGFTRGKKEIKIKDIEMPLEDLIDVWQKPLSKVFKIDPYKIKDEIVYESKEIFKSKSPIIKVSKPKVFIPVFPGTNCEYDVQNAFVKAGAETEIKVFKNLTPAHIDESIELMVEEIKKSQIIMLPGGFSAGDEPEGSGKFIAAVFRNPRISDAVMDLLKNRDGLMLGICNGFQVLIKLGLVPYGEIREMDENCPTLTYNKIGKHMSKIVTTKITSTLSPWLNKVQQGDTHSIAISHGEGRFVCNDEVAKTLFQNGQVATQYVDFQGNPSYDIDFNPNGSSFAIEGITSPDGRVFGKMGHSERIGHNVYKNILGEKDQQIFVSGVEYFK